MNETKEERIRVKVICVFRNADRILVLRVVDPANGRLVHVPFGGGVEFGEGSEAALRREMREELGTEIEEPVLLGVIENQFTYAEKAGHEIVFVYDARFADRSMYEIEEFKMTECNGTEFDALWIDLNDAGPHVPPLCPDGLKALLKQTPIQRFDATPVNRPAIR